MAADLGWILRPGYTLGGYVLSVFSTSHLTPLPLSSNWMTVAVIITITVTIRVTVTVTVTSTFEKA